MKVAILQIFSDVLISSNGSRCLELLIRFPSIQVENCLTLAQTLYKTEYFENEKSEWKKRGSVVDYLPMQLI